MFIDSISIVEKSEVGRMINNLQKLKENMIT